MNPIIENAINEITSIYNQFINNIEASAKNSIDRAYGGVIRSGKGTLVESIADLIIIAGWESIGGKITDLFIDSEKVRIPITTEYLDSIDDENLKEQLIDNKYMLSVDRHVHIKNKFVLGMECKSYTENAMIKRILVDFHLLKKIYPNISCYLLQLESQLGGDYSECNEKTLGSSSTHTLLSYFSDVNLNIITLVKGERKVDKPIHKPEFFKPIASNQIRKSIGQISEDLIKYL